MGIMVGNEPTTSDKIADKSIKFGIDVCFGLLIKAKFGPREFGGIKNGMMASRRCAHRIFFFKILLNQTKIKL